MALWTDDQIRAAVLIAKATSWKEAAEKSGIPFMTLRRRAKQLIEKEKKNKPKPGQKKLERLQREAEDKAVEKASNYIFDRIRGLADSLYGLGNISVEKAKALIEASGINGNRNDAAWLKSLASTFHAAIQDAQLLSGKPTARQDLNVNDEHKITQRMIEQNPDLLDTVFPDPEEDEDGPAKLH